MKDLNYVIGRLQGLYELVKILKDLVGKGGQGNSEVVSVITEHISSQLSAILSEFDELDVKPEHKELVQQIKEKHEEAEEKGEDKGTEEKLEKHEKTVDELLKDLEGLRNQ